MGGRTLDDGLLERLWAGIPGSQSDAELRVITRDDLQSIVTEAIAPHRELAGDAINALKGLLKPSDPMRPHEYKPMVQAARLVIAKAARTGAPA